MSRGFACALFGIAMTLFSWVSPWVWPAWPALTIMRAIPDFAEYSFGVRGAILVALIAVNSAFWALIALGVWRGVQRLTTRRRPGEPA
ncbi:MAG TPA: hypothetical protein VL284_03530 [Thermoanaerobaculia bacterium]|nr:hypothetical protein [Thermoanaerobaculia bacterium]